MTKKEIVNRNIGLTFDFLRQVVNDPAILSNIPDGSTLEFVDKDFALVEKKGKAKRKTNNKYLLVKSHLELL